MRTKWANDSAERGVAYLTGIKVLGILNIKQNKIDRSEGIAMKSISWTLVLFLCFSLISCVRAPIRSSDQAMRPVKAWPELGDDLEFASLLKGLEENVRKLSENPNAVMKFGPREVRADLYIEALKELIVAGREDSSGMKFREVLHSRFDAYEIYGRRQWGEVFMTSYFEPVIEGSLRKNERFKEPIYGVPRDMVEIDVGSFMESRPNLWASDVKALEQRSNYSILRGRLLKADGQSPRVTAYYSRADIVEKGLNGIAPILAWVDPIDAFFLEIQGSGVVRLDDGTELKVGYAAQNGHPYVAVGKFLLDRIPKEKMSIQRIESYLRSIAEAEARELMNRNPSYVFFKKLKDNEGQTFFGTPLVEGRTIATDQAYFPKGALAYLEFEKPIFQSENDIEPVGWEKTKRFVLDQDTGGAIRGPDRLDLYWGRGAKAKQSAGVMKNFGRLIYFVPKLGE